MSERVYIRDRNGNVVNDPAGSEMTGLAWGSAWPGGYGVLSGVVSREIARRWAVKAAYEIVVRDGQRIVYQGRLGALDRQLRRADRQQIEITAQGWGVALREKRLRKRWVDYTPIRRFHWPDDLIEDNLQNSFIPLLREHWIGVLFGATDSWYNQYDGYKEIYSLPAGSTVRRIKADWKLRTGEGFYFYLEDTSYLNVSSRLINQTSPTGATGAFDYTYDSADFAQEIILSFEAASNGGGSGGDLYDQNDYIYLSNVVIYANYDPAHSAYSSPAYSSGEIVEDVLRLAGDDLSGDYHLIGEPGIALEPFETLRDDFEAAVAIIERAAGFGDSAGRTWGLAVWDEFGTSDQKPRAEFSYFDVSDYDYEISLADLGGFRDDESDDYLFNWVVVRYTDERGITRYLSPDSVASLADGGSIARYGRRVSPTLDVGQATASLAQSFGERFLAYHKELLSTLYLTMQGQVRRKSGEWVPANRVRAGQRVKLLGYDGDSIHFIQRTAYDADSQAVTAISGLPVDSVVGLLNQKRLVDARPARVDVSTLGKFRRESAFRKWEPEAH